MMLLFIQMVRSNSRASLYYFKEAGRGGTDTETTYGRQTEEMEEEETDNNNSNKKKTRGALLQ
eukprot:gene855-490_t